MFSIVPKHIEHFPLLIFMGDRESLWSRKAKPNTLTIMVVKIPLIAQTKRMILLRSSRGNRISFSPARTCPSQKKTCRNESGRQVIG
ncbi:MAG: hypothetical protein JXA23_10975 [Bacteroidales bacterium]|nr:hypothetical protein [Bacteroidales bacterium]